MRGEFISEYQKLNSDLKPNCWVLLRQFVGYRAVARRNYSAAIDPGVFAREAILRRTMSM